MGTYKITIAGHERELEFFPVSDKLDIAAFIMFGDVEITEASAKELLKVCPEHDVVLRQRQKVFLFAMKWQDRAAKIMLLLVKALRFI